MFLIRDCRTHQQIKRTSVNGRKNEIGRNTLEAVNSQTMPQFPTLKNQRKQLINWWRISERISESSLNLQSTFV